MVAIFTGSGVGFERGSGSVLGSAGLLGSSSLGRGGEQLFFNAATGNLMVSQRDEFLVGLGLDASVNRTYNSLGDLSDDNGDNWRQGYDKRIVNLTGTLNTAGSTVQRVSDDGSVITYSWDTSKSAYVATDGSGSYDTLTSSGGVWTWTDGDSQVKETYAAYGSYWRLTSQADGDGNTISFAYTGDKLTQVTTADGSTLTYTWSGNNLMSVTSGYQTTADSDLNFIYRLYDAAFDRAPDPGAIASLTAYLKNGGGRPGWGDAIYSSAEYQARGVAAMSNADYVTFLYQSVLRRSPGAGEADSWINRLNTGTSRGQLLFEFSESAEHQTIVAGIPGRSFYGFVTSIRTSYSYDGQGRLSSVTVDMSPEDRSVANGDKYVTTYTYDGASTRIASISQSDGSKIDITYDGSGRVATLVQTASTGVTRTTGINYGTGYTEITDPLGLVTRLDYDSAGQLTKITLPPATAGAAQQQVQFTYNVQGDLTSTTDALGNVTSYAYDGRGNAIYVQDKLGNVIWRTYATDNLVPNPQFNGTDGWGVDADPGGIIAGSPFSGVWDGRTFLRANVNATAAGQIVSLGTDNSHWFDVTAGQDLFVQTGVEALGVIAPVELKIWYQDASGATIGSATIGALFGNQGFNTKIENTITVMAGAAKARLELYAWSTGAGTGSFDIIDPIVRPVMGSGVDAFNRLVTETIHGSDQTQFDAPLTTRFVYDNENHLRYRISAEGHVTEYRYTAAGQQSSIISYTEATYTAGSASLSDLDLWAASLGWTSAIQRTDYVYDPRGGLTKQISYSDLNLNRLQNSPINTATGWVVGYDSHGILNGGSPYTGTWNGKNYIRADVNATAAGQTISLATAFDASFDVAGGERLAIRAGIETQGSIGSAQLTIHYWDASGNYVGSSNVASMAGTQPYDTQLTGFADVPANAARARFELYAHTTAAGSGSAILINPMVSQATADQTQVPTYSSGVAGYTGPTNGGTSASYVRTNFVYDQAGNLKWRYTQGRNTEAFVYDGMGRLTASTDVNAATTAFVFNDAATTTTVTFATGLRQISVYNKAGELLSYTEQAVTATTLGEATGTVNTDAYDKNGRLRWKIDATGRKTYYLYDNAGRKVADVTNPGRMVEYRYDANNRVIATVTYYIALSPTQLTTLDDSNAVIDIATFRPVSSTSDLWSWNIYDKEGRLLQTIDGDGSTSILTYDGRGQLLSTISYYNKLDSTQLASFKTTPPTVVTAPAAHAKDVASRNFYDRDGRLYGVLDGEGFLSRIIYDKAGQKVQETRFAHPTTGDRVNGSFNVLLNSIAQDASDRHTYYSYDGQGQLRYVIDGLGFVTQTDYDGAGQATTVTQYAAALATTSDYTYDNVKTLVASGNLAASVGTHKSWTVYDSAGRAAYAIDAENAVTAFAYNAAGQLIKTTQFTNVRATTSLPSKATMDSWAGANALAATDRITRFYYDGAGVLRYTVDAEGYVSRVDFDAEGRVTKTSSWANKITVGDSTTIDVLHSLVGSSGGAAVETTKTYDKIGRLNRVTDGEGVTVRYDNGFGLTDLATRMVVAEGTADESITDYVYDHAGRLLEEHRAVGTAEASILKYSYDGLGNVLTVTDPLNNVTTFTYDRLGNLATRQDSGGVVSYYYDGFGNVIQEVDKLDRSTYNYYDALNRLIRSRDAEDYITETTYTAFSQVLSVTRRYNKTMDVASVGVWPTVTAHAKDAVTSFEYDRRGLVIKTTDAEGYFEVYGLNAFGNRTSVTSKSYGVDSQGNRLAGGVITNVYDRRGLLISETLPMYAYRADGTVQATTITNKFEYDARGNRTKMIEAFGLTEQRTTNYAYDKVNRLVSKTLDAVTSISYSDFTSTTAVTVTTSTGVVPAETYAYDAAGRLKQVTDALGGRTVSFYDDLGRKTAEVGPLGTMTVWTYDANGNMLTAKVYGDTVTVPAPTATTPPNPINASNYRETVYTYDNLNRLKTTSIANVWAGSWNGSNGVAPALVTLETVLDYDANGNVIKSTDANGNAVYSYYDKLGRKTGQVDQENYITTWTYDGESNVLSETRRATKYAGTPVAGGTVPSVAADATNDRVTTFEYDRNGHRTKETRTAVKIATVNTSNGSITESTVSSVITYSYNGLGQVLTKQEAAGDTVTYTYDQTGRLAKESRDSYTDHASASVTPTVEYLYNGLNNLSRTRQGGATAVAGDRITTYSYGANGRLASMTDPAGYTHSYDYDAAGNLVRDSYARLKSDGVTSVNEGILYRRDLLGRVIGQAIATKNSATSWTRGDGQNTEYNAYGDVLRRGVNGLWQESFFYDTAGRLLKTNSGDGVWRYFFYDKNSNRTLAIESEGTDFLNMSDMDVLNLARPGGVAAGATFVDGLNVSISTYDKRGQALSSILTQRELKAGDPRVTLTTSQTYNAFGEVKSQTDARGYTTDFTYNTMGRLTKKELPSVSWTSETGAVATARPTELYYYDKSGRMVASKDANGNLTSRTLLAGSGHGGAEALVTAEYHADGGIARTFYNVFGDARILRNELNQDEWRDYDAMGRLTYQSHRGGLLVDNYVYDILGQRTRHWNSFLGSGNVERTDYDLQGRVVSQIAFGGDTITTSYAWDGTIATALGTTGGFVKDEFRTGLGTLRIKTDLYGNEVYKQDFGNHVTTWTYDKAGRQTQVTAGSSTVTNTYLNTGLVSTTVDAVGTGRNTITATFGYDAAGNRTAEKYAGTVYSFNPPTGTTSATETLQNATIAYDALGRITSFTDRDAGGTIRITIAKEYDKAGNVRRVLSTYPNIAYPQYGSETTDKWFRYDNMNRMVVADGSLSGTTIVRGGGVDVAYDLAGRRIWQTREAALQGQAWTWVWYPGHGPGSGAPLEFPEEGFNGEYQYVSASYIGERREIYAYTADGYLTTTSFSETGYTDNGDGTVSPNGALGAAVVRARNDRDALGRVTQYREYNEYGTVTQNRYNIVYNGRGQVTSDSLSQVKSGQTYLTHTTNNYATTGTLNYSIADNYLNNNDSDWKDTRSDFTYEWYDDAKGLTTRFDREYGDSSNSIYDSTYYNDGFGRAAYVVIDDGRDRTASFAYTSAGQVLKRQERSSASANPLDLHYYVNGLQIGDLTNNGNNDPNEIDYAQTFVTRGWTNGTGAMRWGTINGVTDGDMGGGGYDYINNVNRGSLGNNSRYTVEGGETLQSISATIYGDASQWYKIAEANGLGAGSMLVAGTSLIIPDQVANSHNNANTFRPYDAADAMGDLSPTTNKPPKKNKCGVFGAVLLVAIAIAVTVVTAGAAAAIAAPGLTLGQGITVALGGSVLAGGATISATTVGLATFGAIGAAAGSIVSQGVGVATGLQDKFSWKSVAMAGLSGAVGGVLGKAIPGANFAAGAARGAIGSAVTQGIGVVTGIQKKFDWAGVAAAAVSGGISAELGRGLPSLRDNNAIANHLSHAGVSAAGAIANAATRSLINGSDFGDNLLAALPDVLGSTLGNMIAQGVSIGGEMRLRNDRISSNVQGLQEILGPEADLSAYQAAASNLAKNPNDPEARRALETETRKLLLANRGNPAVDAFISGAGVKLPAGGSSSPEDMVVTGSRDYFIGSVVDRSGIWLGEQEQSLGAAVGEFIQENPGAGLALRFADTAFAAVAPVKYLGGQALDYFKDEAAGWVSDRMDGPRLWSTEKADAGGHGFVFAGSVLLTGLAGLRGGVNVGTFNTTRRELKLTPSLLNRNLRTLTDADIMRAFKNTGLTPSSHFMSQLRDPRAAALGVRDLRDVQGILRRGVQMDANHGRTAYVRDGMAVVVAPDMTLVTIRPW